MHEALEAPGDPAAGPGSVQRPLLPAATSEEDTAAGAEPGAPPKRRFQGDGL